MRKSKAPFYNALDFVGRNMCCSGVLFVLGFIKIERLFYNDLDFTGKTMCFLESCLFRVLFKSKAPFIMP
jgi:hypothetical protein